jgi:hypothetical protein
MNNLSLVNGTTQVSANSVQLPAGDPSTFTSSGTLGVANSACNTTLTNCWPYTSNCITTYPTYYQCPVQLRPVINGFIVTVGYFYCSDGKWPTQGEYVFSDVKEATKFIASCMEKMLPK